MSFDILPKSLKTNIRFIDEQHAQLLKIAEDIISEFASEPDRDKVEELVMFLSAYTATHFAEEEEFMEVVGYEELAAHKKEHDYYKNYIESVELDIKNTKDLNKISEDILKSLKDWIVDHVKGTDVKMAKMINIPEPFKKMDT